MNEFTTSRVRSLLLVAVMFVSVAAAGPAMAAVSYDTETTNTTTTSDWQDGDTATDLDNSSKDATIEVQSDNASSGDDFTLEIAVNDSDSEQDGEPIYETNEEWTATDATNGHYELNVTYSEVFEDLERDAGESVTLDVTTTVNESEDTEESTTIQITTENDIDTAVSVVNTGDDGLDVSDETASGFRAVSLSSLNPFADDSDDEEFDGAAQSTEDVGVNATNTTDIRVELVNSSAATAGSLAAENADEGDFIGISAVSVDEEYVPVFSQSASDVDWIDTSEDTYATLDESGDTVTVHNVDEMVEESGDVEVSTKVNDGLGFGNARSMLSSYDDLGTMDRLSIAFDANNFNGSPFEEDD